MSNKSMDRLKRRLSEDGESRKEGSRLVRDLIDLATINAMSGSNPKLAKAVTIGSAALTVGSVLKSIWDFYKRTTADATYTIKIAEDDAIFDIVEDWFMEALPEKKQLSVFAHSTVTKESPNRTRRGGLENWERELLENDTPDVPKDKVSIDYSFDGTIVQELEIAGYIVEVYTAVSEAQSKDGKKSLTMPRTINVDCKTVEARNAVLKEIESQSQHLVQTRPRLFTSSKWGDFRKRSFIQPRSRDSVILKEGQMERILDYLTTFLEHKEAYRKADLPYRTGILLHGAPGSGKSSTALAIANELKMNVYIVTLSSLDSDDALGECFGAIPPNSIIILEDIDIAHSVKDRDDDDGVTMSGMLNVLDGFQSPPGVITIMTTNRLDVLDEAIIRPGRVDLLEELNCLDDYQLKGLCKYFTGSVPENLPIITPEDGISSAQIMGEVRKHIPDFENASEDIVKFVNSKLLTAEAA